MKTEAVSLGICKDAMCSIAGCGPVERYDGPGMFCPNCGELLQAYVPEARPKDVVVPETFSNLERGAATLPMSRWNSIVRPLLGCTAVLFVAAVVSVVAGILERAHAATLPTVGLCGSSLSDRLASDIAGAYASQPEATFKSFKLRSANCDVRFFAVLDQPVQDGAGSASAVGSQVARDGIVAIVNPQNHITSLSMRQLRSIFSGGTRDWAAVGGTKGLISVYLPDATTDEGRVVASRLLNGAPVGAVVSRVASSLDVVRAVAAANGRNAIGMVAFSLAQPAKVLGIQNFPPPSRLSIGDRRYPIVLSVRAWTNGGALPEFLKFATSDNAKAVAVRDGFVP